MMINQKKAGVILSYIGQIVNILTGFIYTPIMLKILDQSEYGLYQLVVYSLTSKNEGVHPLILDYSS